MAVWASQVTVAARTTAARAKIARWLCCLWALLGVIAHLHAIMGVLLA
jgi:hypothetical protein